MKLTHVRKGCKIGTLYEILSTLSIISESCDTISYLFQSPRAEAMSLIGSLLCLPNHFDEISVLEPSEKELTVVKCNDVKV